MTKEEIVQKREQSLQAVQQGLSMIENLKGQVAAHRGKLLVYDELLAELGEEAPGPEAVAEKKGEKG